VSLALFFLMPLATAFLLWLWRPVAIQSRRISLFASAILVVWAFTIVARCGEGEVLVHTFGNWAPPFGIVFVVDRLGALFIMLQTVLLFATLVALRPEAHGEKTVTRAHPVLMVATFGLFGAFMTGDLFNLFVMIELVLVSSYMLIQMPGTRRSLVSAIPMIVINTVASALFIAGLGLLYGIGGSLNIADLIGRIGAAPDDLRLAALGMLVAAFATKAALVPLCFWMPATYPTLSAPVAALFAGIMTKLGVYALLRISPLLVYEPVLFTTLMWLGGISALLGVLAALSQYELRRLLSFHSVSQVGYIVLALGLHTFFAIAAAIFFALHHSLVKFTLYLVADDLERSNDSQDLRQMDFRRSGGVLLATVFGIAAFSLAGIPPLSGFFGKLAVFRASFESTEWAGLTLLVIASVFTLASMLKIWRFAFQRRPVEEKVAASSASTSYPTAAVIMSVLIVLFSLSAGPVFNYAYAAAEQLYVVSVLPGGDG
jgi:multicomponent Na+:H+ antiporter subunit D